MPPYRTNATAPKPIARKEARIYGTTWEKTHI
jgi:hypothetical protein